MPLSIRLLAPPFWLRKKVMIPVRHPVPIRPPLPALMIPMMVVAVVVMAAAEMMVVTIALPSNPALPTNQATKKHPQPEGASFFPRMKTGSPEKILMSKIKKQATEKWPASLMIE